MRYTTTAHAATMKVMAGLGLCMLMSVPARAHDLPDNLPVRKLGLWEMVKSGTMEGGAGFKGREQYCLDADADRALHALYILRKELQVVYFDVSCPPPKLEVAGNVFRGEMLCRTNAPNDDAAAGKDFHWEYIFESDSQVKLVEYGMARDILFVGNSEFVEQQRRIGDCAADQKPGDGIIDRPGSREQGEYDNIYESLKVMKKLLNEGREINQRLGPM
ncbi:hypothetical protein GCM10007205_14290 [Oxalicibacterium flavum]|uniref:Uncharacterized protein n=1 Tax=Oxalicibacterium flavum TaxID=179467 RepID=A0A8J2XY03_9BURK|nr:hypothetical protein [Oxalicibacterium flavum]GGC06237.1 hypothetical protein GCM10007205_14290 [Oxalicibacterium flavum]